MVSTHKDWALEQWRDALQGDGASGRKRGRRRDDPSYLVLPVQTRGGSAVAWGCCRWLGLRSATFCAKNNEISWWPECTRLFPQQTLSFFLLLWWHTGIFRDDNVRIHLTQFVRQQFKETGDMTLIHRYSFIDWSPLNPMNQLEKALSSGGWCKIIDDHQWKISVKWIQHDMDINLVAYQNNA